MAATRNTARRPAPDLLDTKAILAELRRHANPAGAAKLARFGITTETALGLAMAEVQAIARRVGRRPDLVDELWATRIYEAQLLCAYVDDPATVTKAQMQRHCRDFADWATCDTLCFALWDRTPHALTMVDAWASARGEFQKRAAFALLAALALHDKERDDADFAHRLPLCATAADDARNFVKKGVLWALNAIGRRSPAMHERTLALCSELAARDEASARWIGKTGLRELKKAKVRGTGASTKKRR